MKPLFSYYGGKQRLASKLVSLLPDHSIYVEPFCGGAALLFAKPLPKLSSSQYREVINDHDNRIITLYRVVRSNPEELSRRLSTTPYSQSEHKLAQDILNSWNDNDEINQAWAVYTSIMQSFNHKIGDWWKRAKKGDNPASTWANRQNRVYEVFERLSKVHISCMDAIECIEYWDTKDSLFYCDPPYVGANQGHYKGYSLEDLKALVGTLSNIEGKFMLSTYKVPELVVPSGWKELTIPSKTSAVHLKTNKKCTDRTEIVYYNFDI